jgi:hypothetical protein
MHLWMCSVWILTEITVVSISVEELSLLDTYPFSSVVYAPTTTYVITRAEFPHTV